MGHRYEQVWKVWADDRNARGYGTAFPLTPPIETEEEARDLKQELEEHFGNRLLPLGVWQVSEMRWQ